MNGLARVGCYLGMMALSAVFAGGQVRQAGELRLGVPVERTIQGGQMDIFTVRAKAGDFLEVVMEQKSVPLVLSISEPGSNSGKQMNPLPDTFGPIWIECEKDGAYPVRAHPADPHAAPGRYVAKLTVLRRATANDAARSQAEAKLNEGERLGHIPSRDVAYDSIKAFEESLKFWNVAGEKYMVPVVLHDIALEYQALGDSQKAIDVFEREVAAWRENGDNYGPVTALQMLSVLYRDAGQKQKSIDSANLAQKLMHDHSSQ